MTKPELGTKRICAGCEAKFYDLHKTPIVCPTCNAVFVVPPPAPMRGRRAVESVAAVATVAAAPVAESKPALKTEPEAELIDEDESADSDATAEKADGEKDTESGDVLLEDIDED